MGSTILFYRLQFVNTIYIYYTYYPHTTSINNAKIAPQQPSISRFGEKKYVQYTLYAPF